MDKAPAGIKGAGLANSAARLDEGLSHGAATARQTLSAIEDLALRIRAGVGAQGAAARSHPLTPPIRITSGIPKSDAPLASDCCMSRAPHQFSPIWIGVRASRLMMALPS